MPAFDNDKYLAEQKKAIIQRVGDSNRRLYLEFGGKLIGDFHAARVLPGFDPNVKIRLLQELSDQADIIVCIHAGDIERKKVRADLGITYDNDALRLIDNPEPTATGLWWGLATGALAFKTTDFLHPIANNLLHYIRSSIQLGRFNPFHGPIVDQAGVERVAVDPGIGFGKDVEHNLALLRHLRDVAPDEVPIVIGTSRKSFLGRLTGAPVEARLPETIASSVAALLAGATIIRVHDVAELRRALTVATAIAWGPGAGGMR